MFLFTRRGRAIASAIAVVAAGIVVTAGVAYAGTDRPVHKTTFSMFAQTAFLNCVKPSPTSPTPNVSVTVKRGDLNDKSTIELHGFKPGLDFDLFTIQHSPQTATGAADANPSVGLAWYQSDIHVGSHGSGSVKIRTVLLDQIFGVDKDVNLAPTNTFNLGFWFANPADAASCGFTGTTPFNGEHNAGPLAFVTRPDAVTNLGPLCTAPVQAGGGVVTCNP
jgi:hypothetical protein